MKSFEQLIETNESGEIPALELMKFCIPPMWKILNCKSFINAIGRIEIHSKCILNTITCNCCLIVSPEFGINLYPDMMINGHLKIFQYLYQEGFIEMPGNSKMPTDEEIMEYTKDTMLSTTVPLRVWEVVKKALEHFMGIKKEVTG